MNQSILKHLNKTSLMVGAFGALITAVGVLSVKVFFLSSSIQKIVCVDIKSIIQEQALFLARQPQGHDDKNINESVNDTVKALVDTLQCQVEALAQAHKCVVLAKGSVLSNVEDKTEELKTRLQEALLESSLNEAKE